MTDRPSNFFCPAPFRSIVQDYHGRCGPCPYQCGEWKLADIPITERWASPAVELLRKKHLSGERAAECERCYQEEEGGFLSHRQMLNDAFPNAFESLKSQEYRKGPKKMVLRLSNLCNYACRTCHSFDSSLFRREGAYYAEHYGDEHSRYVERDPRREFSDEDMQQFILMSGNAEEFEFYGGEPMLNQTHHILLRHLIDSGRAPNVSIFYCTNGSVYPSEERIKLWSHFKIVNLNFSIDAIEQGYHYVRWPGNWEKVSRNLLRFRDELPKQLSGEVRLMSNLTAGSINIHSVPEIFSWLYDFIGEKAWRITTVHDPIYYSIINLPEDVKPRIAEKLLSHSHAKYFQGLINFMMSQQCNPTHWRDFVLWTVKKDAYRKVSFQKTFPEYYQLLKSHFAATLLPYVKRAPVPKVSHP